MVHAEYFGGDLLLVAPVVDCAGRPHLLFETTNLRVDSAPEPGVIVRQRGHHAGV